MWEQRARCQVEGVLALDTNDCCVGALNLCLGFTVCEGDVGDRIHCEPWSEIAKNNFELRMCGHAPESITILTMAVVA